MCARSRFALGTGTSAAYAWFWPHPTVLSRPMLRTVNQQPRLNQALTNESANHRLWRPMSQRRRGWGLVAQLALLTWLVTPTSLLPIATSLHHLLFWIIGFSHLTLLMACLAALGFAMGPSCFAFGALGATCLLYVLCAAQETRRIGDQFCDNDASAALQSQIRPAAVVARLAFFSLRDLSVVDFNHLPAWRLVRCRSGVISTPILHTPTWVRLSQPALAMVGSSWSSLGLQCGERAVYGRVLGAAWLRRLELANGPTTLGAFPILRPDNLTADANSILTQATYRRVCVNSCLSVVGHQQIMPTFTRLAPNSASVLLQAPLAWSRIGPGTVRCRCFEMLSLSSLPGLPNLEPAFYAQHAIEVGALVPATAQTGLVALDAAIEVLLTTQAGLLLTLPAYLHWGSHFSAHWATLVDVVGELQVQLLRSHSGLIQSQLVMVAPLGLQALGITRSLDRGLWLLESSDLGIVFAELAAVCWLTGLLSRLGFSRARVTTGYDDLVTLCQQRGLSAAELASLTTFSVGLVVFDMFVTLAEDDALEAVSYVFGCIIGLAVVLLVVAIDLQYYYMVSAVSGGEATLRLFYTDFVNNSLCLLRVFFCWIRYLFYDLQSELVDFAFHYTELAEEQALEEFSARYVLGDSGTCAGWAWLSGMAAGAIGVFADAVSLLVQLLIGGFKLALALFLFWLILDLFLLRTAARAEALGFTQARELSRGFRRS